MRAGRTHTLGAKNSAELMNCSPSSAPAILTMRRRRCVQRLPQRLDLQGRHWLSLLSNKGAALEASLQPALTRHMRCTINATPVEAPQAMRQHGTGGQGQHTPHGCIGNIHACIQAARCSRACVHGGGGQVVAICESSGSSQLAAVGSLT